jgi:YidC/Oxa1 family membrane protein insertase
VIKRNPTPGSPAYEELQKKKAAKGLIELPAVEEKAPDTPQGQRQQPKKNKKKRR